MASCSEDFRISARNRAGKRNRGIDHGNTRRRARQPQRSSCLLGTKHEPALVHAGRAYRRVPLLPARPRSRRQSAYLLPAGHTHRGSCVRSRPPMAPRTRPTFLLRSTACILDRHREFRPRLQSKPLRPYFPCHRRPDHVRRGLFLDRLAILFAASQNADFRLHRLVHRGGIGYGNARASHRPLCGASRLADRRHHRAAARFRRAIQSRPELCAYRIRPEYNPARRPPRSKDGSARGSTSARRAAGGKRGSKKPAGAYRCSCAATCDRTVVQFDRIMGQRGRRSARDRGRGRLLPRLNSVSCPLRTRHTGEDNRMAPRFEVSASVHHRHRRSVSRGVPKRRPWDTRRSAGRPHAAGRLVCARAVLDRRGHRHRCAHHALVPCCGSPCWAAEWLSAA